MQAYQLYHLRFTSAYETFDKIGITKHDIFVRYAKNMKEYKNYSIDVIDI